MTLTQLESAVATLARELIELRQSLVDQPSKRARPAGGGGTGLSFGVIRQVINDNDLFVMMTMVEMVETDNPDVPIWRLPVSTSTKIRTEPGYPAWSYRKWVWEGQEGDTYPKDWVPGMVMLPIFTYQGKQIVIHHSHLMPVNPLPATMPYTDCFLTDGTAAVEFG